MIKTPNELVETTLSGLLNAGTLRYDMDAIADSFVLLDYNRIGGGSGTSDMTLLVLASLFDAAAETDYVYFYSHPPGLKIPFKLIFGIYCREAVITV